MEKVAEDKLRIDAWFGKRKDLACVRTVCSHIENMINGVQTVCVVLVVHASFVVGVGGYFMLHELGEARTHGGVGGGKGVGGGGVRMPLEAG